MKPTTSYGSLGLHDDDYDGLTENTTPSQISSAPESATYLKSMAVVTGLLLISAAAVSVSQFAGVSILPTTNKAAKLDSVNRPVYANLAGMARFIATHLSVCPSVEFLACAPLFFSVVVPPFFSTLHCFF
jgi:hypothetical protein